LRRLLRILFSASIEALNPAAKLLYIMYPPIAAKITANTTTLALLKRVADKARGFEKCLCRFFLKKFNIFYPLILKQ
jgi:hypothetical protein